MKCFFSLFFLSFFAQNLGAVTYFSGDIAQTLYKLMPGKGIAYVGPVSIKVKVTEERDLQCAKRPQNNVIYKCRAPSKDTNNVITLQGETAKMLFNAMRMKNQAATSNVFIEGAVSCEKTLGEFSSYQCAIRI